MPAYACCSSDSTARGSRRHARSSVRTTALRVSGPGDVVSIPPGHDAEIIGDETCVFLDFSGFESYAKEE
jgi:hypothetical protein